MKPYVLFTRSDGRTLRVDDELLGVTALEGVGKPTLEIFTEKKASGSGDVVTGKRLGSRLITVRASARVHGINARIRDMVSGFFHSQYTYEAEFHYDGVTRSAVDCELKALELPTGNVHSNFRFAVSLLCPSGYLQGGGLNGQNINAILPAFAFPYVSPVGVGFNAGVYMFSKDVSIVNDGASPTDLRVVMTVRGDVENPSIYKNDGESYIRVLETMYEGDKLEIDVANRSVRLNGKSIINRVDRYSSFAGMKLGIGESRIGFSADRGDNLLDVSLYWAKQYETL